MYLQAIDFIVYTYTRIGKLLQFANPFAVYFHLTTLSR